MKGILKFATLTLISLAVLLLGSSQQAAAAAKPLNLTRGVIGPVSANSSWANYSVLNAIPGAGLIPITSANTVFYLGFTAGSTADISNMVLYTTARGSLTITAATPVKLGGVSNPSINLTSPSVCPIVEISTFNPCIVRLDPVAVSLSALNDYYLVVFFTNDSNNSTIGATVPRFSLSSLNGWFIGGTDETRIAVGGSIPAGNSGAQPYFLMYVMSN
jgi:hypothetical protein